MLRKTVLALTIGASASVGAAAASVLPSEIGGCTETRIAQITEDFPAAPGGGSVIHYENGAQQLSFDKIPGLETTQIGDAVRVCLVAVARNCPPGDERGRTYEGTNLRTGLTWRAPDTLLHDCSGA